MRFEKCDNCARYGGCTVAVQDNGRWDEYCDYISFGSMSCENNCSTETQGIYLMSE